MNFSSTNWQEIIEKLKAAGFTGVAPGNIAGKIHGFRLRSASFYIDTTHKTCAVVAEYQSRIDGEFYGKKDGVEFMFGPRGGTLKIEKFEA